jgi:CBS domain-containing protein
MLTVQDLLEGHGVPVTVTAETQVTDAVQLMLEHDFSQLPVVDAENRPLGLLSMDSLMRASRYFDLPISALRVSHALDEHASTYRLDDDLSDLLDDLGNRFAVLILDGHGALKGILTTYDAMAYFRRHTEDIVWAKDAEDNLKDILRASFTKEDGEPDADAVASAIDAITPSQKALLKNFKNAIRTLMRLIGTGDQLVDPTLIEQAFSEHLEDKVKPKQFDQLDLSEYIELFLHRDRWPTFASIVRLDPGPIRKLLGDLRSTRNDLAHFRWPITSQKREQLRFAGDWLGRLRDDTVRHLGERGANGRQNTATVPVVPQTVAPPERVEADTSRYAALASYLQEQPGNVNILELTFEMVEQVMGTRLPPSSRHRSWWANDSVGHAQSQRWLNAGWRVSAIDLAARKVTFARMPERQQAYFEFFGQLVERLKSSLLAGKSVASNGRNWLPIIQIPPCTIVFSFTSGRKSRVELYIDTGNRDKNKALFDALYGQREAIEEALRVPVTWERLDDARASRIACYRDIFITDGPEQLAELQTWAAELLPRFAQLMKGRVTSKVQSIS